jgi:uncharacterized protein (TIGR00725 family)
VTVAVIGASEAPRELYQTARWIGRLLAASGAVVVTGGRGGVMEAACRGALAHGGVTIGILPGDGPEDSPANDYVLYPIYTGLGDARNAVIVRTAQAVIAIGGGFGTLSEIGLALKANRPVVLLDSWDPRPPQSVAGMGLLLRRAESPREAVQLAIAAAGGALPELVSLPETDLRRDDSAEPASG